jgi:hypothetical protein
MDLQEMIWSSAAPKANRRHSLPVEFSKELLDIVLHHGQKRVSPIILHTLVPVQAKP